MGGFVNVGDLEFKGLLSRYKKMTVYGLSPDVQKASHYVPVYMKKQGWDIVGVYPQPHTKGGFSLYGNLWQVPLEFRRFVVVFRSSDKILQVVEEVLALGGVEVLWFQLGISNDVAEQLAEKAGIAVVSNRCLIIEHQNYFS